MRNAHQTATRAVRYEWENPEYECWKAAIQVAAFDLGELVRWDGDIQRCVAFASASNVALGEWIDQRGEVYGV